MEDIKICPKCESKMVKREEFYRNTQGNSVYVTEPYYICDNINCRWIVMVERKRK